MKGSHFLSILSEPLLRTNPVRCLEQLLQR
jgi:hypothetical protein